MKANKLFSLDIELIDKLKQESNASALINELIKAHYDTMNFDNLTPEQNEIFMPLLEKVAIAQKDYQEAETKIKAFLEEIKK